jgi:hypothetical protein
MMVKLDKPGRESVNYHKYTTSLFGALGTFQIILMYLVQRYASTNYHGMTYYVSWTELCLFTDFSWAFDLSA